MCLCAIRWGGNGKEQKAPLCACGRSDSHGPGLPPLHTTAGALRQVHGSQPRPPWKGVGTLRTLAQVLKAVCSLRRWHSDPAPELQGQHRQSVPSSTGGHLYKLPQGKAFGLVCLSEDSEVREKSHLQGQLVFVF